MHLSWLSSIFRHVTSSLVHFFEDDINLLGKCFAVLQEWEFELSLPLINSFCGLICYNNTCKHLKHQISKLRWPNTVFAHTFADAIQRMHKDWKTNMPSIEQSFYLLNTRTICSIFLHYWTQCIDAFSLLLQCYIRKGNDAKNPAILSFFFVTERTQLNAAHAQLLEKLRPIAFAETCQFLTIQSLEFQEIWQKNNSETTRMIYRKKSESWHREFLII